MTPNGKIDRKTLATRNEGPAPTNRFAAPRDRLELEVAQIWAKVLKIERVGIDDNFFELGGHSLLAVRMAVEIEKLCRVRLPLATLLQNPTVAELAARLREKQSGSWSSLVPMRTAGSKPPLFLLHAHGGNTLEYRELAKLLGEDQPVYALQARGLDGHIVCESSIEQMAAAYIEELRIVRPRGPYFLAGFCFGGLLALEMAQQLTAAGHEVPLLVLIQSINPKAFRWRPEISKLRRLWSVASKRFDLELQNLSYRGAGYLLQRWRWGWDRAHAKAVLAIRRRLQKSSTDLSDLPMHCIFEALAIEHSKVALNYEPKPYRGEVVLFRASKQLRGTMADDLLGWREIFGGNVEVCELAGHQQNLLLQPRVAQLAAELGRRLKAAQQQSETPAQRAA